MMNLGRHMSNINGSSKQGYSFAVSCPVEDAKRLAGYEWPFDTGGGISVR